MSRKLPTTKKSRYVNSYIPTVRMESGAFGSLELTTRLSQTNDLLEQIRLSVNTNYEKEREAYKNQKKIAVY